METNEYFGDKEDPKSGDMLRREVHSLIRRYGQESDMTVYQALGALRVVEHDILAMLENRHLDGL